MGGFRSAAFGKAAEHAPPTDLGRLRQPNVSSHSATVGRYRDAERRNSARCKARYPHDRDTYAERSPINHVDRLSAPVIFFQGAEDRVVPPNQTELMVAALKERGVPVGYLLFDGEQHGFRKAENIKRALDAELYFYAMLILRSGLRF